MGNSNTTEHEPLNEMTESDLVIPRKKPKLNYDGIDITFTPEFLFLDKFEGNFSYEILTSYDLIRLMNKSIKEVQAIIQLPVKTVRTLLCHFKWDKEVLLERLYMNENMSNLFDTLGIVPEPQTTAKLESSEDEECEICYADASTDSMYSLHCGHKFCVKCWKDYLSSKITKDGMSEKITCPAHKCSVCIEENTVMELVTNGTVIDKYNRNLAKAFVESSRFIRWCLAPGCFRAIATEQNIQNKPATCHCGYVFCFRCAVPWHGPLTCSLSKKWSERGALDAANSNWISMNTKACPKCGTAIEKNGGCNHIFCKNCWHHFCWICLGPWREHDQVFAWNCTVPQSARKPSVASQSSLEHYLFYFNRYLNHRNSLNFENKLYKTIKAKMKEMERRKEMTYLEMTFLLKSLDVLCSCRTALMNTYAFAYYLDKNTQSEIFQDNQRDFAMATEALSEYIYKITTMHPADMKKTDKSNYCNRRRQVLLEHVYEGYEKNWWKYNVNYY